MSPETPVYMPAKFTDSRGHNIKPNSWSESSENPSLFNVVYHFMYDDLYGLNRSEMHNLSDIIRAKYSTNGGSYRTNNFDKDDSFSLDESIAVASACYKYKEYIGPIGLGFKKHFRYLNIWTKQTFFRFYDVIPYLYLCKYPWTRFLLLPQLLVLISMYVALRSPREKTSGKQLAYVKAHTFSDTLWMGAFIWFVDEFMDIDWPEVFQIYYPEEDHPIPMMAKELW